MCSKRWLSVLLLCAAPVLAVGGKFTGSPPSTAEGGIASTTVAALPACAAGTAGEIYSVTDGASGTDCTVGGGADVHLCYCDGTSWALPDSGLAATATALAANGANCAAGQYPLGVDASGAVEDCTAAAVGDVVGPAASTDHAIARFDLATGKLLQDSVLTVADTTGDITAPGAWTIATGSANGSLILSPHGTGSVVIPTSKGFKFYGLGVGDTDYERLSISATAGTGFTIAPETNGTGGDNLSIILDAAGTGTVQAPGQGTYADDAVQIGPGAVANGGYDNYGAVAIGQNASATLGYAPIAIGFGASAGAAGDTNIAIGLNASATDGSAIAIGNDADATADCIALGADCSAAGLAVIGRPEMRILAQTAATPVALSAPDRTGATNGAGSNLVIAGGRATGNAAGGDVKIQTSVAGASGTTLQTLADVAVFDELRDVTFYSLGGDGATNYEGLKIDHTAGTGTALAAVTGGTGEDNLSLIFKPAGTGEFYFGADGITDATPVYARVNATGGSGTDVVGANLILAGGKATGNAAGGDVVIQTSAAGVSSDTPQTLGPVLRVGSDQATYIGDGGVTNYVKVASDGHMTFAGTATYWDDVLVPGAMLRDVGAAAADFDQWGARPLYAYHFEAASDEELYGSIQMPHSWAGTPIYFHAHWTPETNSDGNPANQQVRWCIDYTWSEYNEVFPATTTAICGLGPSEEPVADKHYITDIGTLTPGTGADKGSSILYFRLYRDADHADDDYEHEAILLSIDAHFEANRLGSNTAEPD